MQNYKKFLKAIAKIDKGQTNDDVEKTVVNGIAEIENILPATTVKDKAKADVNAEKSRKTYKLIVMMKQRLKKISC